MDSKKNHIVVLVHILGFFFAFGYAAFYWTGMHAWAFYAHRMTMAFGGALIVWWLRLHCLQTPENRAFLYAILIWAFMFRLILVAFVPATQADVYRYVWDGKMQVCGINPYLYSPDSEELAVFRDHVIYPRINHPHLRTIYPPVAQFFFRIAYQIGGGSVWGYKIMALITELLTLLVMIAILRIRNLPLVNILLYAWFPVPILEFFITGHVDCFGVLLFSVFAYHYIANKDCVAAVFLALASNVKYYPLVILPYLLIRWIRQDKWTPVLIFIGVFILCYLPFLDAGWSIFLSLGVYLREWEFNSPIYHLFQNRNINYMMAIVWVVMIQMTVRSDIKCFLWMLLGFLLMMPAVYPWYLTWLLPFLIIFTSPIIYVMLTMMQVVYFSQVQLQYYGVWKLPPYMMVIEYIPVLVFGMVQVLRSYPLSKQKKLYS
ncbi:MAG: hypothetical protein Q8Q33_00330 [Chlamydiota bacterium]|nr:hypothetical protein [Chlamydiota bacterium]